MCKKISGKKQGIENTCKKSLVPTHILQNQKVPRTFMHFNNHAQKFTGPKYLDLDNPMQDYNFFLLLHVNKSQWI